MKINDRVLNIIEDHESITQALDQIVSALENGSPMPNYIPVLHDTLMTDHLSRICEELNKGRNGK